jgi:hypothetical protein
MSAALSSTPAMSDPVVPSSKHAEARLSKAKPHAGAHAGADDESSGTPQTVVRATSIFHRSWFWIAVGVGAVVVSAGVGYLIVRSRKSAAKTHEESAAKTPKTHEESAAKTPEAK